MGEREGTADATSRPRRRPTRPASPSRRGAPRSPTASTRDRARRPRPRLRLRRPTLPPLLLIVLCALAVLPVAAGTVVALVDGWTPVGADAAIALRTRDVLHGDAPSTGLPTPEALGRANDHLDHPGPLETWVGSVPYTLLGPPGLLLAVAAVNAASLVVVVLVGWRRGATAMAVAATGASLALCWSLGRAVLVDPLNTRVALIPWFAVLLLAWEVRAGHWRSLPVAVLLAGWCLHAHLAYLPMVVVLGVGSAILIAVDGRGADPTARRRARRRRRGPLAASGAIAAVLALPLVLDQLSGSGNLGQIARSSTRSGLGPLRALQVLVAAFGLPPAWLRGASDPFALLRRATLLDVLAFALTIGACAWLAVQARDRGERDGSTLVQAGALAAAAATIAVARVPAAGGVAVVDAMALWRPVTLFVWFGAGWALWQRLAPALAPHAKGRTRRWVLAGCGAVAALAVTAVTVAAPDRGVAYGSELRGPADVLGAEVVDTLKDQEMVQVNAIGAAATSYLRPAVIEQLERAGIPTRTTDEGRLLGRADRTQDPTATIWVVSDPVEARAPEPGTVPVEQADLTPGGPLSAAAQRRRQLRDLLDGARQVQLRSSGRLSLDDALRGYFAGSPVVEPGDRTIPASNLTVDAAVDLARAGLIASPALPRDLVAQIEADRVGRTESGDDMEAAVYVRYEGGAQSG